MKNKKLRSGVLTRALAGGLLFGMGGLLFGVSGLPAYLQRDDTPSHLQEVLNEEKKNLGLDKVDIKLVFGKTPKGTAAVDGTQGKYTITLDNLRNRFALRHEMYHILQFEKRYSLHNSGALISHEREEMEYRANNYAFTGLKF